MPEYVITTNDLTKIFGRKTAVSAVNMNVSKGDIYGLIGENGAGKTTIMRMIAGLASISKGNLKLFESENLTEGRKRLGCVIENPALYPNMTARENLEAFRRIAGDTRENICEEILKIVGLNDVDKKKAKNFSLGMKQRLSIGISLLGDPDLLILDEPINGLDPTGIKDVRDLIVKLSQQYGKTILISSHILEELSKVATRYGIIKKGVLVEELSSEELEAKCSKNLRIVVDNVEAASKLISDKFTTNFNVINGNTLIINYDVDAIGTINTALVKEDIVVSNLSVDSTEAEDYFIEIMKGVK